MSETVSCVGCERNVAAGTALFHGRVPFGERFLCEECAQLLRDGAESDASGGQKRVLQRIRDFGLGMAGGRTGAVGGPG